MRKILKGAVAAAIIGIGIWRFATWTELSSTQSEAERLLTDAKARAEILHAEADARARIAAEVAAKTAEQRAAEQQAWDSAFREDYNRERDARWRELTSPH